MQTTHAQPAEDNHRRQTTPFRQAPREYRTLPLNVKPSNPLHKGPASRTWLKTKRGDHMTQTQDSRPAEIAASAAKAKGDAGIPAVFDFSKVDTDGDGSVSFKELEHAIGIDPVVRGCFSNSTQTRMVS